MVGQYHISNLFDPPVFSLPIIFTYQQVFISSCRKRLFNVLKIEESQSTTINYKEIIYVSCFIIICVVISILRISMRELIDINGAFLGFVFIYLIPSLLHIKCMYFSKGKVPLGSLIKKGRSV